MPEPVAVEEIQPVAPTDEEPEVSCSDPPGTIEPIGMPGPVASEADWENHGWLTVGALHFRKGCIPPTYLQSDLMGVESALLACFDQATTGTFTGQLRFEWAWRSSRIAVTATALRIPEPDEPSVEPRGSAPTVDEAQLLPCVEQAVAGIYVSHDADLPAVVDVEIERGFPAEGGGTVMGRP